MLLELVLSVERMTGLQLRMVGGGERTLTSFATDIVNELIGPPEGAASEPETQPSPVPVTQGEVYGKLH